MTSQYLEEQRAPHTPDYNDESVRAHGEILHLWAFYLSRPEHSQNQPFIIVIGGAGGRNHSSHSCFMGVYLSRHGPEQNKKKQTNNVK